MRDDDTMNLDVLAKAKRDLAEVGAALEEGCFVTLCIEAAPQPLALEIEKIGENVMVRMVVHDPTPQLREWFDWCAELSAREFQMVIIVRKIYLVSVRRALDSNDLDTFVEAWRRLRESC